MATKETCPKCWREHSGACDTRTIEQRKADENRAAVKESARKLGKK